MSHVLALLALALDVAVRAWRIQLAAWTAGGTLGFWPAVRLNLYGEAASTLTPNRLGGEAARFAGLTEAGLRSVTALVAVGVEVAAEWPVFLLMALALGLHYVPDWRDAAKRWLSRHLASDLVWIELVALGVLVAVYVIQRFVRSGTIRHRVRRQWRVAWAHVRRAPLWVQALNAALTAVSLSARAMILPALAWGIAGAPPFSEMFFGSLALLASPLLVPLPSGGGGIEVVFLSGFAGDFGERQVSMLLLWRFYSVIVLTVIGVYLMVHSLGARAAKELMTIGWAKRAKHPEPSQGVDDTDP
jgi:uncharacterized membrane protein YbhN (UPF0104 family)